MDYQAIFNEFAEIIKIVTPIAISFGLCQWIIRFILSAILGDYRGSIN